MGIEDCDRESENLIVPGRCEPIALMIMEATLCGECDWLLYVATFHQQAT